MKRRLAACLVVVFASLGILGRELLWEYSFQRSAPPVASKPFNLPPCSGCNLIVLSMDTLRADFAREAPHISSIAGQSINFDRAYANAFYTTPSHMTLFTSLYPNRHKVTGRAIHVPRWPRSSDESAPLEPKYQTLAEVLSTAGYRSEWFAPLNLKHLDPALGFGRGFKKFSPSLFLRPGRPGSGFNSAGLSAALRQSGPFFYFLHSYVTHLPYFLPDEGGSFPLLFGTRQLMEDYFKLSERAESLPEACASLGQVSRCLRSPAYADSFLHDLGQYQLWAMEAVLGAGRDKKIKMEQRAALKQAYANSVRNLDNQVGEFWSQLHASGHDRDTVVVFFGDHGEELFEHGHASHSSFYEHTVHVPLIIYHPKLAQPVSTQALVSLVDVMPTILKILEVPPPVQMQGHNLAQPDGVPVFGYALGNDYVFDGSWKLIRGPSGEEEFYFLPSDPNEKTNLLRYRWPRIRHALERLRAERRRWEVEQTL